MKLALDPYMLRRVPLTELPGVVAELGYQYIELSPREDFLPFFLHPRADRAGIAGVAGTVAGDDTILVVCNERTQGRVMARHLAALAVTPDVPAIAEPYRGATA
jgi:sugar phosphate isomerase/epimerase